MLLTQLIMAEIRHRKAAFWVAVLVVAGVLFCLALSFASLDAFDEETDTRLEELQKATDKRMVGLENKIRKSMKGLGFNVHIYPESQNLSEVYEQGFATETMPEDYVHKLANSKVVTVNHLLPRLSQRLLWKEQNRTIVMIGIKGQVPIAHRDPKKPIMLPVKPGEVVLGYELHQSTGLKQGDEVVLNGVKLTVAKVHPQRGTMDDITAWIPLETAQSMLGKPGRINAILALGCNCATIDRLGEIRKEIGAILPGVKIIEIESKALARAEARNKVGADAAESKAAVVATRKAARGERKRFTAILMPLVIIAGLIGVAALSFLNTRVREGELGTLRAIGFSTGKVAGLILGRATMIGTTGASVGAILAWLLAPSLVSASPPVVLLLCLVVGAPVLTVAAAWLPAFAAMQRDPLDSLRHD